ncbi:MAG: NUDIX hydrolase [Anaerolineae bacterium]
MARQRATAVMIRDGEILMVRMEDQDGTLWYLPGGGIEPGETPEQAVVREMQEELNLQVTPLDRLFIEPLPNGEGAEYGILIAPTSETPHLGIDPAVVEWAWRPLADISLFAYPAPALLNLQRSRTG